MIELFKESDLLAYYFLFDEASPSNNVLKRLHFQKYKNLRHKAHCLFKDQLIQQLACEQNITSSQVDLKSIIPLDKAFFYIKRHSTKTLDWDNVYGGIKPLIDTFSVASTSNPDGLGIIVDDSLMHVPLPPIIEQCKSKLNATRTEIFIFKLNKELNYSEVINFILNKVQ